MSLDPPSHETPWWRPLGTRDRRALWCLLIVPTFFFVVPALFGHPAIDGDNLIQNFPLRVLSGRQIWSGHLPLLDPYANSGTPLLGGLNAGALYPLTVLFAFVPPIAAWLVNLIAVYFVASSGLFALLRWHGVRSVSAFAAAMSFAYSGAMIGQLVHLGVVQGFSFIPWTVLILVAFSRRLALVDARATWRHYARVALPWTLGYAFVWGMTFLTGEPRAIADIELLTLIVGPAVLLLRATYWMSTLRARVTYVVALGVGLAWGAAIALVQLLPGWSFIGSSQRSVVTYNFFGAGSLALRWTSLLFVPDILGGNGSFGQPGFFAHYNLPEVTGYAGVLALLAFFAFLTRVTRRGWRGPERDFTLYVVIVVVGLFATWGSYTPLGHLFRAIPLFGNTRLQSRNIIIVDFALAAVLGWWFDRLEARRSDDAGLEGRTKWVTLSPALVIVTFCTGLLAWGPQIVSYLGVYPQQIAFATDERLSYALHLVIALAAVLALLYWRHSKQLLRTLLTVLTLDVVIFVALSSTATLGEYGATMPSRTNAVAVLGGTGRFAFVDLGGSHQQAFEALGVPNMNVFTGLASVQGYGSLISTIYNRSTGTHPQSKVDPCRLADGTFTQLRLRTIVISSSVLAYNVRFHLPLTPNCRSPQLSHEAVRYFGRVMPVREVILSGPGGRVLSHGLIVFQFLDKHGRLTPPARDVSSVNKATLTFAKNSNPAAGFVLRSTSNVDLRHVVVVPVDRSLPTYSLDTQFQEAMDSPQWRLHDVVGTYGVFRVTHLMAAESLVNATGASRVTHVRNALWGDTWVNVRASAPVVLKRSVAYLPGWRASAHNTVTGATVALPVTRHGLIQQVTVPTGSWIVHFHYHAPYIELGVTASTVGVVAMTGAVLFLIVEERRRSKGKVRT